MKAGPLEMWIPDDDNHSGVIYEHSRRYDMFRRHIEGDGVAVDGGAHVGYWTLRLQHDYNLVLAFEPNPSTFNCLELNVSQFNNGNVNIINAALGAAFGYGNMRQGGRQGNTGAWYVDTSNDPTASIEVVTLDSYISGLPLNLVKLDVEGMEHAALVGGERWITRDWPAVIIEQNIAASRNLGLDNNAAQDLLREWGYELKASAGKDYLYTRGKV